MTTRLASHKTASIICKHYCGYRILLLGQGALLKSLVVLLRGIDSEVHFLDT